MQSNIQNRRSFIKSAGLVSLGFLGLTQYVNGKSFLTPAANNAGYGALLADPQGILNLPKGFSYKVIFRQGDKMTDGFFGPDYPDGMATFKGKNDRVILIRNHETNPGHENGPYGKNLELLGKLKPEQVYDYGEGKQPGTGGTSTLIFNEKTGEVETSYLSLAGTVRNCAGGMTPWRSWISCEENTSRAGEGLEKDHGYNFEVPASEKINLADPLPLKEMGRFNHEAVCVDPRTSIVYQTEDRGDGLIYRFLPNKKEKLHKGGTLQVLAIKGQKSFDTRNWKDLETPKMPKNEKMEVEWLDIDNVEAPEDDLRLRGFESGAARFARGEGMWFGDDELYFACTNGGEIGSGQVFRYVPSTYEGTEREKEAPGTVELFLEPNDQDILKNCDNLTIAPWGDIILCEDHPEPFVVGVTQQGEIYKLAENVGYRTEFAGGVFSPSGDTYFVNIQGAGITLAITGPWKKPA
ncbi:secreted PhoX family phosphatase [Catalinimonas alkaloidigena]|uniref:alkaline phosphatase PhoX n=1 Tax=Catalinimonas alkaloidigena TaxID=1075417 RepID=UPI0024049297|nr:alkaline phosphatase PhoX [Catalinimonas alkaloidigena]MDF9798083.1 secreted PhoX family phosphatase [Catalinimonas alkaloidigena]